MEKNEYVQFHTVSANCHMTSIKAPKKRLVKYVNKDMTHSFIILVHINSIQVYLYSAFHDANRCKAALHRIVLLIHNF